MQLEHTIIIFDLEATCKENDRTFDNEIIEIGSVKVSPTLERTDEFTTFVQPVANPKLTPFCTELTTITQAEVDGAPRFPEAFQSFREWIGQEPFLLLSWGAYDRKQIEKDCARWRLDANWVSRRHINLKQLHAEQVLGGKKQVGMSKALGMAGLELNGTHHRGIDDARNIAAIFIHYREVWNLKGLM
ncbi:3'-5' exonuclease [Saccharibacillus sacchari]|uniref:3'-5' exonuclease n=1 Tax=Saccharibacillus sacchari TaxID=456493 RepID=A0ACC6P758_9BACL